MNKLLSAILVSFFALSSVSAVPLPVSKNPKTCCGRQICLCTHAKGEKCTFKHGEEKAVKQSKPSCHLNSKMKSGHDSHRTNHAAKEPETKSRFRAAPCHSSNPESTAPNIAKDFFIDIYGSAVTVLANERLQFSSTLFPSFIFSDRIKHPPRASLNF